MFYQTNGKGKVRLTRDPTAAMRAQVPQDAPQLTYWQKKLIRARITWFWWFLPATPQKAGKIIDASYEKLYAMAEPDYDWKEKSERFRLSKIRLNFRYVIETMVDCIEPAYCKIHDLYLRIMGDRKSVPILIALRRYKNEKGRWPEGLDDVRPLAPAEIFVDPINNGCFVYRLTDDGFTLYSKGKNNIDEKGIRENEDEGGPDDRLIWPPKSKRAEKADKNNEG